MSVAMKRNTGSYGPSRSGFVLVALTCILFMCLAIAQFVDNRVSLWGTLLFLAIILSLLAYSIGVLVLQRVTVMGDRICVRQWTGRTKEYSVASIREHWTVCSGGYLVLCLSIRGEKTVRIHISETDSRNFIAALEATKEE